MNPLPEVRADLGTRPAPDSPVVELNRAVAVAEVDGPEAGSASSIASPSRTTATCTRRGASCCAASAERKRPATPYRRALALVHDDAERRLLERRLAELGTATGQAMT